MIRVRLTSTLASLALVLIAAYSLAIMSLLFMIDLIVNETLYSYGLQFSADWATQYWTAIRTGFAISWLVIITAIAFQVYLTRKTKEKPEERRETESMKEETWSAYTLSDGSTIKVKHKLKSAKRLDAYSPNGMPIYVVDYDNIVQVVNVPEKLVKKTKESSA
jgi:membrane-bound ClpP family serine protease